MELRHLTGTARRIGKGTGPLVGVCVLRAGERSDRHAIDGAFELVDAAGQRHRIEITGEQVLSATRRRATYAALADEPGVAALTLHPGPHVVVELEARWIADGDVVAVAGEVIETRLGESAYREAPAPTGLIVRALAAGDDAAVMRWGAPGLERPLAGAPQRRQPTAWPGTIAWSAIALVLGATAIASCSARVLPSLAAGAASAAAAVAWARVRMPRFDGWERRLPGEHFLRYGIVLGTGLAMIGPPGMILIPGGILVLAVATWRSQRTAARLVRLLAQPVTAPRAGAFGVFRGRVRDATPVELQGIAAAFGTEHEVQGTGEDATVSASEHGFGTTFQLDTGDTVLEIAPRDAVWTSEVVVWRGAVYSLLIPVGAEAVIAGRPDDRLRVSATGPESLVIYGAASGADAQATLRQLLARRRLALLVSLVAVAYTIALLVFQNAGLTD